MWCELWFNGPVNRFFQEVDLRVPYRTNRWMTDDLVAISSERLRVLLELEANLPNMIQQAVLEYKKDNLSKLHERDKANPAALNARVKRYMEKHRDEINRKRREKRTQLKECTNTQTHVIAESVVTEVITIEKVAKKAVAAIKPRIRKEPSAIVQSTMDIKDDVNVDFE